MEYRGVEFSIERGSTADGWRWRVLVGEPAMLRVGEEQSKNRAIVRVQNVIDRAISVRDLLRSDIPRSR